MKLSKFIFLSLFGFLMISCVSKKKFAAIQTQFDVANKQLGECGEKLNSQMTRITELQGQLNSCNSKVKLKDEQMKDLRAQLADVKTQRDKTVTQVGDLTVLSQSANTNINKTLSQLEGKDKYIRLLQAAKTKTDSINLALAVNLKTVLRDGIDDSDVEVKVDKTVVFVNLSDKMLFTSGSSTITSRADEVLGKIAAIVKSRPGFEVMVEGYTDNVPMSSNCIKDNWDLSVMRSTSVVKALQNKHGIDPNRLIAAGRGEYNALAGNDTAEGRSTNRRTRIIILPKLDQFYDLLNPANVPE